MLCLLYCLSRVVNTVLYAISLVFALVGGSISIVYATKILDEISLQVFSPYLSHSMISLVNVVGVTIGTVTIVASLVGIMFITPF